MSLIPLTFSIPNHNSKLYFSKYIKEKEKVTFSKKDLNSIICVYSKNVSNGNWKDYSINFNNHEAKFCFYKHTLVSPEYALIKYKNNKNNKFCYRLKIADKSNKDMENIDKLITHLKREYIKIVK